jgi:hypothetical protein
MKNTINWFEIPVKDFERAKKFYSTILDFDMKEEQMGPFRMGFLPYEQGAVSGAICHGEGYEPSASGTLVYLNAEGIMDDILSRIEPAGGKIVLPRTNITPEIGDMAMFMDPEGNKIALHTPVK